MYNIDLKEIHRELKRCNSPFVKKNYEDIFQQTYILVAEGLDYKVAAQKAINITRKEIGDPRLRNSTIVKIDSIDIPEEAQKPLEIVKRPLSRAEYRGLYGKFKNLSQVSAVLEKLNFQFYALKSTDGKYDEGIQLANRPCPICGTKKSCFSIYKTIKSKKVDITYSCLSIRKGDHYKTYSNDLSGIFSALLQTTERKAKKIIYKILLEMD